MMTSKKSLTPLPVIGMVVPLKVVDDVPLPSFNNPVPEMLPVTVYEMLAAGVSEVPFTIRLLKVLVPAPDMATVPLKVVVPSDV